MPVSLADIRTSFLDYFAAREHKIVPSSPLVPHNDPTLMFTNAGMVPFKDCFTGASQPIAPRVVSAQKCVRAGGKHNDLDNVGYTARHHTFFEMLGNFSFGDYFKEEAILYAWEFLTRTLELSSEKLLVTVYADDDDAFELWRKISGFGDDRIIRIATADNFWAMGATGPCGPCSEVFYDHGEAIAGGPPGSADEDGDRFIEIWNLVFMQFEQMQDEARQALPSPSIDTGMGLERIAAILQGKHDNYDTDLMRALRMASAEVSHHSIDGEHSVSHRVIADHLRASAFLIADGVLPANEGRGYVLRRIMRRAMRHAFVLGAQDPLLWQLVPALNAQMGDAYPELNRARALIIETLRLEEERFRKTLTRGMKLLDEECGKLSGTKLSGETAFKLYDTYGFPLDLTQDALRERGLSVDIEGFENAMAHQRDMARAHWEGSGEAATDAIWFDLHATHGASEFVGYQTDTADGVVLAMLDSKTQQIIDTANAGDDILLLVNQTPFYAESGGQVGDRGGAHTSPPAEDTRLTITNTLKKNNALHVLCAHIDKGVLRVGMPLHQQIDSTRRQKIRVNHSVTHLLHAALREVLGEHITQKGSLVDAEHLRFDISHMKPISPDEIAQIETLVNAQIRGNSAVTTRLTTPEDAITAGAMALFGEKYGDEVRVLSMGAARDNETQNAFSVELCGGTHVAHLGEIGVFKIVGESAIAAGIRRIEAYTAAAALTYMDEQANIVRDLSALFNTSSKDIVARVGKLMQDTKTLTKQAQAQAQSTMRTTLTKAPIETINNISFLGQILEDVSGKDLQELTNFALKHVETQKTDSEGESDGRGEAGGGGGESGEGGEAGGGGGESGGIVALVSLAGGKAMLAVGVSAHLCDTYDAVRLVREGAVELGGKTGGGKSHLAQAGGPNGSKTNAQNAINRIKKL